MPKIIFSDFDRTLFFKDEPSLTESNINAINEWRKAGNRFCITTGRSYESVTTAMPEIKTICDFYILDGGSITLDSQQNILHINCFDSEIPPQIESQAAKLPFGCKLLYYTPEGVSLTHDQPQITKARLWFKDEINFPLIHQTFADLPVQIFEWRGENRPDHPKFPEFDVFAEFVPLNSGKEKAIRTYADAHRLPLTDIIAIGDGDNDCEMIKQFNGYMIKDSTLDRLRTPLKTTPSLSALIHQLLSTDK